MSAAVIPADRRLDAAAIPSGTPTLSGVGLLFALQPLNRGPAADHADHADDPPPRDEPLDGLRVP